MAFSSKEAAEKMSGGSSISKVIQPGNIIARVLDIKLEVPPYDSSAYNIVLTLETEPIPDFEGLAIDKENPELGNYKGQVGRVQTQQYSYSDYTSKEGKVTRKEDMIFRWLWNFAKEIGASEKLIADDIQADSIEDYLDAAKKYLISPERYIHFCIAGSEYENKAGYTQYRLFIAKPEKNKLGYELYKAGETPTKLLKFDEALHVKRKKVEKLDSFESKADDNDLAL